MKKILSIVSMILVSLCLLFTVSCSKSIDEVSNFKINPDTLTLSWDRVIGATNYTILISGEEFEKSTKNNNISLEYLEPGTYEIKVRANSDGNEKNSSDWATYTFVREKESGMRYKLINNKTEYQLIGLGTASGDIVMDDVYRGKPVTSIADKAFSGNTKITSFVVGKNVKEIGKSAFSRCAELTSITIPDNVTKIGSSCFQSCKKLETFTFPNSVDKVDEYMFAWCSALKTVSFGDSIESVGLYAFSNCDSLEEVEFGDSLQLIDEYAFSTCKSLSKINLGNSLEVIAPYAFYDDIKLSDIQMGSSVKNIGEYAFGNCDAITSLTVPDSCEKIGNYAFRYCDNLAELKFATEESSLKSVGYGIVFNTQMYFDATEDLKIDGWFIYQKNKDVTNVNLKDIKGIAIGAFNNCDELVNFMGNGVKYVDDEAFSGCDKLMYATFNSELLTIGARAFKGCKKLNTVILGSKIESIGDFAFSGCQALNADKIFEVNNQKTTAFPKSLTHIGKDAFKSIINNNIKDGVIYVKDWAVSYNTGTGGMVMAPSQIKIKSGTRGIADYAFTEIPIGQVDTSIYGIDIADSVEYLGRGAFYKTAANGFVVTVKLPKHLKQIGDYAFYGAYCAYFGGMNCVLEIPDETEYIGRSAFYGCQSIFSLSVPGSVKEISPYAFYGCTNIGATIEGKTDDEPDIPGYITLAEGIEKISDRAFYGCAGIQYLTIPDSVTSIGLRAFYKCAGIKELTIGTGITAIEDYAFYGCSLLEKIVMSDNVKTIGNYAFRGCNSLNSIKLSASLTKIGNFAFFGAENLSELVIPNGVTSIGKHAFRDMKRVHSIIIPSSVESILSHAFYGAENSVIYIEENTKTENWDVRWNSSFAPVVTGCTLSQDKTYIVSFVKDSTNPDNMPIDVAIEAPVRSGYKFVGFSTESGSNEVKYTINNIIEAPNGTTLYTLWEPV